MKGAKYHHFPLPDDARPLSIDFGDTDLDGGPDAPVTQQPRQLSGDGTADHDGLRFISLGSGSSGNCAYLGTDGEGLLIDAGIDVKTVFERLRRNGIDPTAVRGIILTHDHNDHVRYVYTMIRAYRHLRVCCTLRLLNGLLRRHNISGRIKDYHIPIFKEIPFKLAGLTITAFETSHDGTDNMGFSITKGDHTFVVATDMGAITERALHYMSQANYLMVESNYDHEMLVNGHYPEMLKHRVMSVHGHMDNADTARFLARHYHPGLTHVMLCHLSHDNNRPDLALASARDALLSLGLTVGDASNSPDQRQCDVQLIALPRFEASPWIIF